MDQETPTTTIRINHGPLRSDLRAFSTWAKAPKVRTIREFAEQEIIIAGNGRYRGFKFSLSRQPHVRLWFDAISSGQFRRYVMTGPSQSGKSLIGFVIIAMYYLFEMGETVILGLPTMEMASDKWKKDIEPAIRLSKYRKLLPTRGTGSRGGKFESVTFKNGATLKFMSGGGDDKKRSSYDARILIVTETDGLDTPGDSSREADPLQQLEARTASFGDDARIFLECTVSEETGRTWKEIKAGTDSRIALKCPHCCKLSTPGRESLIGWQGAEDEVSAYEQSAYYCDLCGEKWNEEERRVAHVEAKLVHKGQEVTDVGEIVGAAPRTFTLGYRYSAVNNLLVTAGNIGSKEWRASKSDNQENDERALCQFVWAVPPKPSKVSLVDLDVEKLAERMQQPGRGFVPSDCNTVTVGMDIGKDVCHWAAIAWRSQAIGQVIDYGVVETTARYIGEDQGIALAVRQVADMAEAGWMRGTEQIPASLVFVDSGYNSEVVYECCKAHPLLTFPSKGFSSSEYSRPTSVGRGTVSIGKGYHVQRLHSSGGVRLVEFDADYWKTRLHEGYQCVPTSPGAITLFHSVEKNTHFSFAKHQTAEKKEQSFDGRKGEVVRWVKVSRNNHWLDATVLAMVAGCHAGVKLNDNENDKPAAVAPVSGWFASQARR